jgi:hypothetical protein
MERIEHEEKHVAVEFTARAAFFLMLAAKRQKNLKQSEVHVSFSFDYHTQLQFSCTFYCAIGR